MSDLLSDLTPPQRQAVTTTEGPLLVLAAAGSGKTRVITRRIAYLIEMGVPPWSICALTFTNKAAGEMRDRVEHLLLGEQRTERDERRIRGLTVLTFHALCARLLRRFAAISGLPGLKPDFAIYDAADQTTAVKSVINDLNLSTKNWPVASVRAAISHAKNELKDATTYAASASDFAAKQVARIYAGYEQALRRANAIDFDDLLLLTARMLRTNAEVRNLCRDRWSYLMIDEYQDTNHAQFVIASTLAGEPSEKPNICVVGDADQAIYSWRGADISNILEFEERFPDAVVITLGENFRSTAPILKAADTLIKHNVRRKDKPLFTSRAGGQRPRVILCSNERHESELVVNWFRSLSQEGLPWREMAVFYRTNALSRVMEDALRTGGIPYTIARGTAFYEREEVKHALAYLRVVANPADDVCLERIINTPARGIGKTSLVRIADVASASGCPMLEVMRRIEAVAGLTPRAVAAVQRFVAMIDGWTGAGAFLGADVPSSLHELVERVICESGLEKHYESQASTSGLSSDADRLDNLAELVSSAKDFEDEFDAVSDPAAEMVFSDDGPSVDTPPLLSMLRAYLESIALVADADAVDPEQGTVTLMTLHAAKGLEFGAVAIIGLEQGLLPHSRANESPDDLEEERRLAFVGITRAMSQLTLTSARYRTIRGLTERMIPSVFLEELGPTVNISDQSGDAFEQDSGSWRWPTTRASPASPSSLSDPAPQRFGSPPTSGAAADFPVGCTVRHPQFGLGQVISVQGGSNARAQVKFRQVGVKTLVLEFARLKRVHDAT
ncbi:MAG: UvrD-helicase domain-containing protein [Phycisphaerales bacterium]|nr:UvrD-helicase domain-containing protein [Phycisphaerales bacterium]